MNQLADRCVLRSMYKSDLHSVLEIIYQHDDDDGEAAEEELNDLGLEGHHVIVDGDTVLGATGYRPVEGCDQTYYLSWTYLTESARGQGLGKRMLREAMDELANQGARKIFVKVSDYQEDGVNIYGSALAMYKSFGFKEELISQDFYDEGESQTILGYYFDAGSESDDDLQVQEEKPVIRFNGLFEIAETEGAYSFAWTVEKTKGFLNKRNFDAQDVQVGLDAVRDEGGRKVFLTFPSNLVLIHRPLQATGFKYVGRLKDYYEAGLHELHFSHDLSSW